MVSYSSCFPVIFFLSMYNDYLACSKTAEIWEGQREMKYVFIF